MKNNMQIKDRNLFDEDYQICGILGHGKFATVYKCMYKKTLTYFAAKLIHKDRIQRKDLIKSINIEIKIMNMFSTHTYFPKLYDVYENSHETVLVMELLGGGELFDQIADNEDFLTEEDSAYIIKQVCEGLHTVHSKKIVHMDVKPENICLVSNREAYTKDSASSNTKPQIKLIDFGLAKILTDTPVRDMVGTTEFIAPEIINFEPITTAVDMWALGVTVYIVLTGISPFQGDTDEETYLNILHCDYYSGDELFKDISHDALDFIKKLLVFNPNKRMTAEECLSHPWLKKRKKKLKRTATLLGARDRIRDISENKRMDNTMHAIKHSLRQISVPDHLNIRPSNAGTVLGNDPGEWD